MVWKWSIVSTLLVSKLNQASLCAYSGIKPLLGNLPHTFQHSFWCEMNNIIVHSSAFLSWVADGQYCRVVKESGNYVECACSHFSIYTAYAEMATLASYNEAFYASGLVCISGTKDFKPAVSFLPGYC